MATIGRRFLLVVWITLAMGQANAQTGLQTIGEPVEIAAEENAYFMNPRWSPSGDQIAFTGAGYRGLWLSDPDGGNRHQMTDEAGAGFAYSWSADGSALVARVARYDGVRRYTAVKVFRNGTDSSRVVVDYTTDRVGIPMWLSNDAQIAVLEAETISVIDVPNRNPKNSQPSAPFVISRGDQIVRSDVDSGTAATVSTITGFILNLAISPDGANVAFEVLGGNLFVMEADGRNRTDVGPGNRPQWSPDGRWIVFQRSQDDGHEFTASDLYAASADGRTVVRLTTSMEALEMNPSWSPDGQSIAFDDRGAVYLLPVKED